MSASQTNNTVDKEWKRNLLEERTTLIDINREAARSFDQTMITLSAGALGLSLTFVRYIAPEPVSTIFLIISWICLILSMLSILISFMCTQYSCLNQIKIIDELIEGKTEFKDTSKNSNRWIKRTEIANITSVITFIIGVSLLAFFAINNLEVSTMSKNNSTNRPNREEKGVMLPNLPPRPSTPTPSPTPSEPSKPK